MATVWEEIKKHRSFLIAGLGGAALAALPFVYIGSVIFSRTRLPFESIAPSESLGAIEKERRREDGFGLIIDAQTGDMSYLQGYVGMVLAIQQDENGTVLDVQRIGSFRPDPEMLQAKPLDEIIYQGIVKSGLDLKGTLAEVAAGLKDDQAAELIVSNDLVISYKDPSKIDWRGVRSLIFEPDREYFFVDALVLNTTKYRTYRKINGSSQGSGVGFSAQGEVYVSEEEFRNSRKISLRMWDLRLLHPTQGNAVTERIQEILDAEALSPAEAVEILPLLHQESAELYIPDSEIPKELRSLDPMASTDAASAPVSIAEFQVEGVPVLRQSKPNGCWATAAAMLYGWNAGRRVEPREFLEAATSREWLERYERDAGLSYQDGRRFVDRAGFEFEYGQSYLPSAVEDLLRRYGPLWFMVNFKDGYSHHANVVVGIRHSHDDAFVSYIDPWDGRIHDEKYADFMRRYDDPAVYMNRFHINQLALGELEPMHVVHYAAIDP